MSRKSRGPQIPPSPGCCTLAYAVGIRVRETRRARWHAVDLKTRMMSLSREIIKTGDLRPVLLPKDFDLRPGKADDLVFDLRDCRESWRTACIRAGAGYYECRACASRCSGKACPKRGVTRVKKLTYRGLRLRHTRHSAIRNLVDAGVLRQRAKAITGHVTEPFFNWYDIR
jgi:hypothetical protein